MTLYTAILVLCIAAEDCAAYQIEKTFWNLKGCKTSVEFARIEFMRRFVIAWWTENETPPSAMTVVCLCQERAGA